MQDFVNFANFIGGTPLHVLLFVVVYTLWKRIVHLEQKLEDCLDSGKLHTTTKTKAK